MNGAASPPVKAGNRADAQRERILCAALKCFIEHGFHAASMANIAEAAQMSAGLMYRYFENKGDFFRVLAEAAASRMIDLIDELHLDAAPDDLRAWLRHWLAAYRADGGVISTWQDMQTSPELRAFSQQVAASVFTRLEKLLDQRDFGHPQVAASMLLALLERAPYRVHTLGFSTRAGEIDATATIIRRGFLGIDER